MPMNLDRKARPGDTVEDGDLIAVRVHLEAGTATVTFKAGIDGNPGGSTTTSSVPLTGAAVGAAAVLKAWGLNIVKDQVGL